jgi:hypothetical protein
MARLRSDGGYRVRALLSRVDLAQERAVECPRAYANLLEVSVLRTKNDVLRGL